MPSNAVLFENNGCYCVHSTSLGDLTVKKLSELACGDCLRNLKVVELDGEVFIKVPNCIFKEKIRIASKNGGC